MGNVGGTLILVGIALSVFEPMGQCSGEPSKIFALAERDLPKIIAELMMKPHQCPRSS